jgi:hypothetical protein
MKIKLKNHNEINYYLIKKIIVVVFYVIKIYYCPNIIEMHV